MCLGSDGFEGFDGIELGKMMKHVHLMRMLRISWDFRVIF
jgi:hypothetical protein